MTDNTTTPQDDHAAAPAPTATGRWGLADSLADRVLALQEELTEAHRAVGDIRGRLIATTVEMGQENDYCLDGMSEFIAPVLAITTTEARKLLEQSMTRRYSVTIEYEMCGTAEYPDSFTESEAESFIMDAINPTSGTTVDVLHVWVEEV